MAIVNRNGRNTRIAEEAINTTSPDVKPMLSACYHLKCRTIARIDRQSSSENILTDVNRHPLYHANRFSELFLKSKVAEENEATLRNAGEVALDLYINLALRAMARGEYDEAAQLFLKAEKLSDTLYEEYSDDILKDKFLELNFSADLDSPPDNLNYPYYLFCKMFLAVKMLETPTENVSNFVTLQSILTEAKKFEVNLKNGSLELKPDIAESIPELLVKCFQLHAVSAFASGILSNCENSCKLAFRSMLFLPNQEIFFRKTAALFCRLIDISTEQDPHRANKLIREMRLIAQKFYSVHDLPDLKQDILKILVTLALKNNQANLALEFFQVLANDDVETFLNENTQEFQKLYEKIESALSKIENYIKEYRPSEESVARTKEREFLDKLLTQIKEKSEKKQSQTAIVNNGLRVLRAILRLFDADPKSINEKKLKRLFKRTERTVQNGLKKPELRNSTKFQELHRKLKSEFRNLNTN